MFVVPLFEISLVQTTPQKQSDGIVQKLHWGIRVIPECLDFLAILDPTEEDLGCIDGGVCAPELRVVLEECGGRPASIGCG